MKFAGTFAGRLAASACAGAIRASDSAARVARRRVMSVRTPVGASALRVAALELQGRLAERAERGLLDHGAGLDAQQAGPVERVELVAVVGEPRVPVGALDPHPLAVLG